MKELEDAIRKIEAQQPKVQDAVWGVGEQLKDLLRDEPGLAEIVSRDLDVKEMGIADCEKKIKERADEIHRTSKGASVCIRPEEAEAIIRRFYGLPERGVDWTGPGGSEVINLADFF